MKFKLSVKLSVTILLWVSPWRYLMSIKVNDEANFMDDLGADSLDTVELVMAFEEEFGSEISDSEAEKILTVGDAIKFIENKAA